MSARRAGIFPIANRGAASDYPLVKVACHYTVVDVHVHARLTQTYVSKTRSAQDVMYVFPLPSDAAVCAFSAVIDDTRTIHGVVKQKDEAKRMYERAVLRGRTAGLLEQHSADVFEVYLGNLKPGQKIAVNISYVSIIAHDGKLDSLRLRVPLSIAPNYGTPPASLGQRFSKFLGTSKPLELTMAFDMPSNISSITSQTHPIDVSLGRLSSKSQRKATLDPTKAHVTLHTGGMLNADVVVVLECAELDRPRCVLERGSTSAAIALTLVPHFGQPLLPAQEYIFLIDRSGSMDGGRIAAVRAALQIMLRSLPTRGTTFNLLSFGNRCDTLWPASAEYSADSVREAAAHVDAMGADYGGTAIRAALRTAFEARGNGPSMVLLLTDGEAWDVAGVVQETEDAVRGSDGRLRVFVLGVGNQVSTNMCDAIARAGHGVVSYVGEQEKLGAKLMNMLKAARGGAVIDISIDWGVPDGTVDDYELVERNDDVNTERAPASPTPAQAISLFDSSLRPDSDVKLGPEPDELPPVPRIQQSTTAKLGALYPGFRTTLFAIIQQPSTDAPTPTRVIVNGKVSGTTVSLEVPIINSVPSVKLKEPVNLLHVLAARAFVQELELDRNASPVVNALITRLGTSYSIASSQTSFVAVDEKGDAIRTSQKGGKIDKTAISEESLLQVEIVPDEEPISRGSWSTFPLRMVTADEQPRGRGGTSTLPPIVSTAIIANAVPTPQCFDLEPYVPVPPTPGGASSRIPRVEVPARSNAELVGSTLPGPSTIEALARQQRFDGSFAAAPDFYNLLGAPSASSLIPAGILTLARLSNDMKANVWATIVTIAFLRKMFRDEADSWALFAEKACDFILQVLSDDVGVGNAQATALVDKWLDAATNVLP
ncbi:hypothetical protein AURDEDRAFT_179544 [Auricularia subglabra TFB-10046 SS5]|nr:hypothetical protein AURDEDRAFT_179544 [Auricularia subglabra TFB-10046 SS5]